MLKLKNFLGYFHHGIGKIGHRRQKRRKNIATAKEAKRKKNKEMNEIRFVVITRDSDTGRRPAGRQTRGGLGTHVSTARVEIPLKNRSRFERFERFSSKI